MNNRMLSPWWVRKAIYVVATIIGLALVALNIIDPASVDNVATTLTPLVSMLVAGIGGLAAFKTGADSDNARPVADFEDVAEAVREAVDTATPTVTAVSEKLVETLPTLEELRQLIERG